MFVEILHRLIGVAVLVLVLSRLGDWISAHLQGLTLLLSRNKQLASFFLFLVLAPGILLHELSHWLMARFLGVRTKGFRVGPRRARGGNIQMGAVEVRGGGPVSLALIGMAPFLVGTVMLVVLGGWWQANYAGMADWRQWFSTQTRHVLLAFLDRPDWPWRFYAIWVVANSMMPSQSDREPLKPVLLVLAAVGAVAYFVGVVPSVPPALFRALVALLDLFAGAFLLAVLGNGVVAGGLTLVEWGVGYLLGVRVDYR